MITEQEAIANISRNVTDLIAERGLSQNKLAKMTGLAQMSMNYYARGERMPGAVALSRMAEALDVSIDYLLEDHRPKKNRRRA